MASKFLNSLRLATFTTTQRNALSASVGDTILNSTTGNLNCYNGAWLEIVMPVGVGDGSTDNTSAIQAAIDRLGATGGLVLFGPGVFISGTLTLPSNVVLEGAGYSATTLKLKTGTNASLIVSTDFFSLTGTDDSGGTHSFGVRNMSIDGNKANNTFGFGIQVYGYDFILENLRVHDCKQDGIYTEWSGTTFTAPSPDSMEASMINVKTHDCGNNGVTWNGPHDSLWLNCLSFGNTNHGFHVKGTAALLAVNCHSWNAGNICWYLEGEAALINCVGEGSGGAASQPQVFVGANDCQFIGGSYYASGTGKIGFTIGDGDHTLISGTVINTKILNCTTAAVYLNQDNGDNTFAGQLYNSPALGGTTNRTSRYDLRSSVNRGGSITTPSVPATTVAQVNTQGVDATVYITGGTVTAIVVDGVTLGLTSGSVRVPCGNYIAITYSVTPTWKWLGD